MLFRNVRFHLYSIWLFTFSDLKTIIIPSTLFGLINGIALSLDPPSIYYNLPRASEVLYRTHIILFWVWINLLPFAINNQRQLAAIQEDSLNKPWRTMPSRRMSPHVAKHLMLLFYPLAIFTSLQFGNLLQSLTLVVIGTWYNVFGGADVNFVVRNLINAGGFTCFSSGALQVAIGYRGRRDIENGEYASALTLLGWWSFMIACVVFTTVQIQDMEDQLGDAARNRRTLPLVIGDGLARWSIALPMLVWCWLMPWMITSSFLGYLLPVGLGATVVIRTLGVRSVDGDKLTFRLWNLWLVTVYLLPLIKAMGSHLSFKSTIVPFIQIYT